MCEVLWMFLMWCLMCFWCFIMMVMESIDFLGRWLNCVKYLLFCLCLVVK